MGALLVAGDTRDELGPTGDGKSRKRRKRRRRRGDDGSGWPWWRQREAGLRGSGGGSAQRGRVGEGKEGGCRAKVYVHHLSPLPSESHPHLSGSSP